MLLMFVIILLAAMYSYIDVIASELKELVESRDRLREMLLSSTIAAYGSKKEVVIFTDNPNELVEELLKCC